MPLKFNPELNWNHLISLGGVVIALLVGYKVTSANFETHATNQKTTEEKVDNRLVILENKVQDLQQESAANKVRFETIISTLNEIKTKLEKRDEGLAKITRK